MSVSIQKICGLVYMAVLASLIVDIGGAFGVKYAVSGLLLVWVLVLVVRVGIRRDLAIEFGVLLYFAFSVSYSMFRGVELTDIYGQLSFVTYFFLLFAVLYMPGDAATDSFRRIMVFGALIVIGTFLSILLYPESLIAWNILGDSYRMGYLGIQTIGGQEFPNVYYRWSMWLIPAFIISIGKYRLASVLLGAAALITLSTSVIAFTVLGSALLILVLRNRYAVSLRSVSYAGAVVVIGLVVLELNFSVSVLLYENIASKFSTSSFSTNVKLGHIEGVLQSMQASLPSILFGTGVGSEFYSPGIRDYAINIEVSHFNFLRQFGLIGGAVFFGYVLYVILSALTTDALGKRWAIGLLMLFGAAGTNPLLMSPVFMVVLVTVRAYVAQYQAEKGYG